MQVVDKSGVRQATAEDVDAFIAKVMRELLYPVFLRKKLRKEIREFLCNVIGLEEALSKLPADQLRFRIGEPRELAQAFAETCSYVRLRGAMPIWKKRLVAAALIVSVMIAVFFAARAVDQWAHNCGYWDNSQLPPFFAEMNE